MIRVSPGAGPPGVFAPAREARTNPADPGASFDDALTSVEPPAPPVIERTAPRKPEREEAAPEPSVTPGAEVESPDNTARTTTAQDVSEPAEKAAPVEAHETGDPARAPDVDGAAKRAAEVGAARPTTGDAGAKPVVVRSATGPARSAESPAQGATPPSGATAGSAPATDAQVPKGEVAPDQPAPGGGEPKARGGGFRPRREDGVPQRLWPKHFREARLDLRPEPNLRVEGAPETAPEGAATAGPVTTGSFPTGRTQEAAAHVEARVPAGTPGEGSAQAAPIAAGGEGNGAQAKGDGSGAQTRTPGGAGPARPVEPSAPKAEAGGPAAAEGGSARIGVEQVGFGLGPGRAVGAPRTAPGSAGSAPQADRAAGLEGAVTRGFSAVMRQNGGSVVIRLSPESLGPVRISMSLDSTSVSVTLEAGTAKAHELLSQSLGSLRQSLEAQGLRVERMGVTLSAPHPSSSGPAADGAAPQRGSEDSGFGDQDAADGRSRGHADQESRDRHGGAQGDPTHPFGTFSELFDSPGTPLRFVATA